jgi:hypothetical protein
MILDAKSGLRGVLINEETGQRIPFARWADTETGEYEAFATTPDGQAMLQPAQVIRGRARLRFVASSSFVYPAKPSQEADPELVQQHRGVPVLAVAGRECEERYCHRLATWKTAEEREIDPEVGSDGQSYERAITTVVHYWCDWHYRNPLFTNRRGVTQEVEVRARPQ